MKNKDYYSGRDGAWSAFNRFCWVNAKPSSNDCTGCPCYGQARGMNSCYNQWLEMEAEGEREEQPRLPRPWSYEEAKAVIGKVIEYSRPNRSRAAYLVIGAYQAQNGMTTVLMAGDAISVEKLARDEHYMIGGRRCVKEEGENRRVNAPAPLHQEGRRDWA